VVEVSVFLMVGRGSIPPTGCYLLALHHTHPVPHDIVAA